MNWLWIFLPVALVVIAAVVALPLWQSIWAQDGRTRRRWTAMTACAACAARPPGRTRRLSRALSTSTTDRR